MLENIRHELKSWLAHYTIELDRSQNRTVDSNGVISSSNKSDFDKGSDYGKYIAQISACSSAGVPDTEIYDITVNKKFKGLRIVMRLSENKYYE